MVATGFVYILNGISRIFGPNRDNGFNTIETINDDHSTICNKSNHSKLVKNIQIWMGFRIKVGWNLVLGWGGKEVIGVTGRRLIWLGRLGEWNLKEARFPWAPSLTNPLWGNPIGRQFMWYSFTRMLHFPAFIAEGKIRALRISKLLTLMTTLNGPLSSHSRSVWFGQISTTGILKPIYRKMIHDFPE